MDTLRSSLSSFPGSLTRVNRYDGAPPPCADYRPWVRRILRIERGLLAWRPRAYVPPPEPPGAVEVLSELAARFKAGDKVGLRDVVEVCGVPQSVASGVRRWAQACGLWPYRKGKPRAAAWSRNDDYPRGGEE